MRVNNGHRFKNTVKTSCLLFLTSSFQQSQARSPSKVEVLTFRPENETKRAALSWSTVCGFF